MWLVFTRPPGSPAPCLAFSFTRSPSLALRPLPAAVPTSLWRQSVDSLRELSARNPVYLICFIWQQADKLFSGQQAEESSTEPGCKALLAQVVRTTIISGKVTKGSDGCQLSPTLRNPCWNGTRTSARWFWIGSEAADVMLVSTSQDGILLHWPWGSLIASGAEHIPLLKTDHLLQAESLPVSSAAF